MVDINRIYQGEQIREDKSGFEATIRQIVIEAGAAVDGACNAHADPGTYEIGDPHPCIPGLECTDKVTRPTERDNTTFYVDYIFRAPEPERTEAAEFAMAGSLAEVEATRDRDGNQVVLFHEYDPTYKDPFLAGRLSAQVAEFQVARPTLLLRWNRIRNDFSTAWANRAVLGTVNSAAQWGFGPELLLCTRMEIESSGQKYQESYEFQTTGEPWTVSAVFRQEDDGRPVENPVVGVDEKNIAPYSTYNYALLGLQLPT